MPPRTFWIRCFLIGSAFLFLANRLQAQTTVGVLSVDAPPRAAKADTTSTAAIAESTGKKCVMLLNIDRAVSGNALSASDLAFVSAA